MCRTVISRLIGWRPPPPPGFPRSVIKREHGKINKLTFDWNVKLRVHGFSTAQGTQILHIKREYKQGFKKKKKKVQDSRNEKEEQRRNIWADAGILIMFCITV